MFKRVFLGGFLWFWYGSNAREETNSILVIIFKLKKKSERNTLRKGIELIIFLTSWVMVGNIWIVMMSTIGKRSFEILKRDPRTDLHTFYINGFPEKLSVYKMHFEFKIFFSHAFVFIILKLNWWFSKYRNSTKLFFVNFFPTLTQACIIS